MPQPLSKGSPPPQGPKDPKRTWADMVPLNYCMSLCIYIYIFIYLFIYLSIYLPIYLSVHMYIPLYLCMHIYSFIHLFVHLFSYLYVLYMYMYMLYDLSRTASNLSRHVEQLLMLSSWKRIRCVCKRTNISTNACSRSVYVSVFAARQPTAEDRLTQRTKHLNLRSPQRGCKLLVRSRDFEYLAREPSPSQSP